MAAPVIRLLYGNIQIIPDQPNGNITTIDVDPDNGNIRVSINGQSLEFGATQVYNVSYRGSQGGGDIFINRTALVQLCYFNGGSNTVTGGSTWNYNFFNGDNNTYTTGGFSDVWWTGGTGCQVINPQRLPVQIYP